MNAHNGFYNNSVFWVEVDRIYPNPYQPRREFDQQALEDLADSIRQYGVLQPLVVTRKETQREDGSIYVEYELLAGERRLRAAKLAGLTQVPVLIREKEDTDKVKLEIAIIENLQREDLNPIDRAKAFKQLAEEFGMSHAEIAKKIGKSREYVSNSIRLLALPDKIQQSVINKDISEGHARALLMLVDRPQEQETVFKEILLKKLNVRETEKIARSIATERARKKPLPPKLSKIEKELTEELGTRVQIEPKQKGGKIKIDFFSEEDLQNLLEIIKRGHQSSNLSMDSIKKAMTGLAAGFGLSQISSDKNTADKHENIDNIEQEQSFGEDIQINQQESDSGDYSKSTNTIVGRGIDTIQETTLPDYHKDIEKDLQEIEQILQAHKTSNELLLDDGTDTELEPPHNMLQDTYPNSQHTAAVYESQNNSHNAQQINHTNPFDTKEFEKELFDIEKQQNEIVNHINNKYNSNFQSDNAQADYVQEQSDNNTSDDDFYSIKNFTV